MTPQTSIRLRRSGGLIIVGAALASLAYGSWVAGPWLNPDVDQITGYVSELAARDQPYSWFFRTCDAIAGLLAAAVGLAWLRRRPVPAGGPPAHRVAALALVVFGVATLADNALAPMDCAPYIDTACALRERALTLSLAHDAHLVTSAVAGLSILLGLAGLTRLGQPVRRLAVVLLVLQVATLGGTIVAMLLGEYTGIIERIQVTGGSLWLLLAGAAPAVAQARESP